MSVAEAGRIRYLSPPQPVSMGDQWYEIASVRHFWIQRRFDVLERIAGPVIRAAHSLADVGCGQGLLQRQIEDRYDLEVNGFDLNEAALKQTVSRKSPVFCYDILQQNAEYGRHFDVIFLFDVLEHLQQIDPFMQAIQFHLAENGKVVVNLPAFQFFWSRYDVAAGHVRRYDIAALRSVAARNQLNVDAWTYWGLPLVPLLLLRKVSLLAKDQDKVIQAGFDPGSPALNKLLVLLARQEPLPQHFVGTSLMAVLSQREPR
jgi:SAM-dependent methyltransferase